MFVDRDHPNFDLAMEVAMLIPCAPLFVPISLIVADLAMPNQADAQYFVSAFKLDAAFNYRPPGGRCRLRTHAISGVRTRNVPNLGRCVQIARAVWPQFQKRAQGYWDGMYDKQPTEFSEPVSSKNPAGLKLKCGQRPTDDDPRPR